MIILSDDSKITTLGPSNPVVVKSDIGVVICEVEAYPPPTIHFCYNGTCSDFKNHNKIEVISHLRKGKYHNARFILHDMNEDDNGNVTCQVIQADRNTTVERQVMIFLPCKYMSAYGMYLVGTFICGYFCNKGSVVV